MTSLNKPGEAPANPETTTTAEDASTDTQPVVESDEKEAETEQEVPPPEETEQEETEQEETDVGPEFKG